MQAFLKALADTHNQYAAGSITAYLVDAHFLNGALFGAVYGDRRERFWNGRRIHTSEVQFSFKWGRYHLATTFTGSTYLIANWRSFEPEGVGRNGEWSADPFFHLAEPLTNDVIAHFDIGQHKWTDAMRERITRLPTSTKERWIPEAHVADDDSSDKPDAVSELLRLASIHMDTARLRDVLAEARSSFINRFKTQMMIEYSRERPYPDLVTMLNLGYAEEWQSILVIDSTFRLAPRALQHLAEHLLEAMDPAVLPAALLDSDQIWVSDDALFSSLAAATRRGRSSSQERVMKPVAVIFDVFGTLIRIEKPQHPYLKLLRYGRRQGRNIQPGHTRTLMTLNLSLCAAAAHLGIELASVELKGLEDMLEQELSSLVLYPDAISAIEQLQAAGIRTGVCSNLAAPYGDPVRRLLPEMHAYGLSYELGMLKPEAEMYRAVCRGMGVQPGNQFSGERVMMIGDSLRCDQDGPRAVGIDGYHLDRDGGKGFQNLLDFVRLLLIEKAR